MLYSQPLSTRFGTNLINLLQSGTWTSLDIAVAWVRASGVAHLESAFSDFLQSGNALRITVGVDLDNTTKEGLASLLALKDFGSVSIFIHHNEAGTIFHPKLYLFQNDTHAKLIVGSNNITEAGLFLNTEAGLELEALIDDQVIVSARDTLDTWRSTDLGLARELDSSFLSELVSNGYVYDEAAIKAHIAERRAKASQKNSSGKKLFKSVAVTPPSKPATNKKDSLSMAPTVNKKTSKAVPSQQDGESLPLPSTNAVGQVLLMRLRRASETSRRTQTQIPKAVAKSPFFEDIDAVTSVLTGHKHVINAASARGAVNTLKLEIPEMRDIEDPVIRFERTPTGIQYEVYDSSSVHGKGIMSALVAGQTTIPPATTLTVPSKPSNSTWWRFI